jgi:hypothetical protein
MKARELPPTPLTAANMAVLNAAKTAGRTTAPLRQCVGPMAKYETFKRQRGRRKRDQQRIDGGAILAPAHHDALGGLCSGATT